MKSSREFQNTHYRRCLQTHLVIAVDVKVCEGKYFPIGLDVQQLDVSFRDQSKPSSLEAINGFVFEFHGPYMPDVALEAWRDAQLGTVIVEQDCIHGSCYTIDHSTNVVFAHLKDIRPNVQRSAIYVLVLLSKHGGPFKLAYKTLLMVILS